MVQRIRLFLKERAKGVELFPIWVEGHRFEEAAEQQRIATKPVAKGRPCWGCATAQCTGCNPAEQNTAHPQRLHVFGPQAVSFVTCSGINPSLLNGELPRRHHAPVSPLCHEDAI